MAQNITQLKGKVDALFATLDSNDTARVEQMVVGRHEKYYKAVADGSAAATTDVGFYQLEASPAINGAMITAVKFHPEAALTANASNFATMTLSYDNAAGGAETVLATVTTATVSWVAGTPVVIPVTAGVTVPAGSQFKFIIAKSGTGVVVPTGTMVVYYQEL